MGAARKSTTSPQNAPRRAQASEPVPEAMDGFAPGPEATEDPYIEADDLGDFEDDDDEE